ncbi:hypothetical protein EDC04DRAFT_2690515, partial [Pisolithus marmoratus]
MCCAVRHFSASVSPITCTITVCMASLADPTVGQRFSAAAGRRITQTTIVSAGSDLLRYPTKCRSLITACKCLYSGRQRHSDCRTSV